MTLSNPFLMTYSSENSPPGEQMERTRRDGKLQSSYSGVSQRPLTHGHYCKPAHQLPRNNNEHKRRWSTVLTQGNSVHFGSKQIARYILTPHCVLVWFVYATSCSLVFFLFFLTFTCRVPLDSLFAHDTLHSHGALTHLVCYNSTAVRISYLGHRKLRRLLKISWELERFI